MWSSKILHYLVGSTNIKLIGTKTSKVTIEEVRKYFGQVCIFGVLKLSEIADLWSTEGIVITYPGKEFGLSKNRWKFLNTHLEFNISVLHSLLLLAFKSHLIPSTFVTIDEVRISAHHKMCDHLHYNPKKPAKWAVESFCVNDSSSYLWSFNDPTSETAPTAFQALVLFADELKSTGRTHHITADNRFSNAEQAQQIIDRGFHCTLACKSVCPTILFKDGLSVDLPQWHSQMAMKGPLVAASYHRNNMVNLITTLYSVQETEHATVPNRKRILNTYDNTKHRSDHFNRRVATYHTPHYHKNWERSIFIAWFEFARTNSYILYNLAYPNTMTHKQFVMKVSLSLLKS